MEQEKINKVLELTKQKATYEEDLAILNIKRVHVVLLDSNSGTHYFDEDLCVNLNVYKQLLKKEIENKLAQVNKELEEL